MRLYVCSVSIDLFGFAHFSPIPLALIGLAECAICIYGIFSLHTPKYIVYTIIHMCIVHTLLYYNTYKYILLHIHSCSMFSFYYFLLSFSGVFYYLGSYAWLCFFFRRGILYFHDSLRLFFYSTMMLHVMVHVLLFLLNIQNYR